MDKEPTKLGIRAWRLIARDARKVMQQMAELQREMSIDEGGAILARIRADIVADQLREQLAAYAHDAWSGWMHYLFAQSVQHADGSVTIPAALVERWQRQMATPYADLPKNERQSDRDEADAMLRLMRGGQ